jgi:alkaline phosphatase D
VPAPLARLLGAAILAVSLCASAGASPRPAPSGFSYGVAAGEIRATSALLWTRAHQAGPVEVEVSRDPDFRRIVARRRAMARMADDLTVRIVLPGLEPGTAYAYRFRQGSALSAVGRFRTAPSPDRAVPVRFAVSGDADATPGPTGAPAFNAFQVYARMAAEENDFNINLGDTIYSDSPVAAKPALTVGEKRAKYRQSLSLAPLRRLRAAAGLYSHWDDHEFVNDFSLPEHGRALYAAGLRAFRDYSPVSYDRASGLYRTFRWGKTLELFFLDERSFRSAKASAGGACRVGRGPHLAPTAPAAIRRAFAALAPSLARPAPRACLARIADPRRTMLGRRQLARFLSDLRRSSATFKVILNEVPLQQFYALPYDRWEGYAAERRKVIEALRRVPRTIVLATDTHANLVGDIRLRTLEPGGPLETGLTEVVTGPVATSTFAREVDTALGVKGAGRLVALLFLKPAPPRGIGMRCAAVDVYSYAQVEATPARLTVTLKDLHGHAVRDVTGKPCPPIVVAAG